MKAMRACPVLNSKSMSSVSVQATIMLMKNVPDVIGRFIGTLFV